VRPERPALDAFWLEACQALPEETLPASYHVRWIGVDAPGTREVFDLILARDKTGTFTLPWIVEHTDQPQSAVGDCIILIDFDGTPQLLVRIDAIHQTAWSRITARDTAVDGSPVRDLATWIPLHTEYWNSILKPFQLAITDDMPVLIERFTPLFSRWKPNSSR
jgi:uncharacterized protein YhfF